MARVVSWFSCGAASAVATKLASPDVVAYCETGSEDPDNDRFMRDCEQWFGVRIERLRSQKYASTWDVWEQKKYIAGIAGAPCTRELKIAPRLEFENPDDVHVFGYTSDAADRKRAQALRENWPELKVVTPLIDRGIDKAACLAMVERAGIVLPKVYSLGFPNANCVPCCKATSPGYWALIRKEYPEQFGRMAKLSRQLGARLALVKSERVFIDEIPEKQELVKPIAPDCDFLCAIAEQDL